MPEQTFAVAPVEDGDAWAAEDVVANQPDTNPLFCGRISAALADRCALYRFDTSVIPRGASIVRAKLTFTLQFAYANDSAPPDGTRRVGILAPDGVWDGVGAFSAASYPTVGDLPRPTDDRSDAIRPGVLYLDQFMTGTLAPTVDPDWGFGDDRILGVGYGDVTDTIGDFATALEAFIVSASYNGRIGLVIDGFGMLDNIDDLRIVSSDSDPTEQFLTIEWEDPPPKPGPPGASGMKVTTTAAAAAGPSPRHGVPQGVALIAQGNDSVTYSSEPVRLTSAKQAAELFGNRSPLSDMTRQLLPIGKPGLGSVPLTAYPVQPDAGGVIAQWQIRPTGTLRVDTFYRVHIGDFVTDPVFVAAGSNSLAVSFVFLLLLIISGVTPFSYALLFGVPACACNAKASGTTPNDYPIWIETLSGGDGMSIDVVLATPGANNGDIDDALSRIGPTWPTMIVHPYGPNVVTLPTLSLWNEGRWLPEVMMPSIAFCGTYADLSVTRLVASFYPLDRTNVILHSGGEHNVPSYDFVARAVARIASRASLEPTRDYAGLSLDPVTTDIVPNYADNALAVGDGVSTVRVRGDVFELSDVITLYQATGEIPLPYSNVVDLVKLFGFVYRLRQAFTAAGWDGAPLIPDGQKTVNPAARSPESARALAASVVDEMAALAFLAAPERVKSSIAASIAGSPKRLALRLSVILAGNANVFDLELGFGLPAQLGG